MPEITCLAASRLVASRRTAGPRPDTADLRVAAERLDPAAKLSPLPLE